MAILRTTEQARRRSRKKKLRKLRARYKDAKSAMEKEKIVAKVGRIAPWVTHEHFVATTKAK